MATFWKYKSFSKLFSMLNINYFTLWPLKYSPPNRTNSSLSGRRLNVDPPLRDYFKINNILLFLNIEPT